MTDPASRRVPQLAYTDNEGNVFMLTSADRHVRQLTWNWEKQGSSGTSQPADRFTYLWPAWAPDGSRVACFGLRRSSGSTLETNLYAVAADGIESWELADLSGGM